MNKAQLIDLSAHIAPENNTGNKVTEVASKATDKCSKDNITKNFFPSFCFEEGLSLRLPKFDCSKLFSLDVKSAFELDDRISQQIR